MPEVVANTSPLQYLFQLGLLDCLPQLYGEVLRLDSSTRADVLELADEQPTAVP